MGQLVLHSKKKFRGNGRRLRAFNTRLQRISRYPLLPTDSESNRYDNCKIPAPRKAFLGRQRIANQWLKAWFAHGIEWLQNQAPQYISCIITLTPNAFALEYCTFFSCDYFRSFIHRQDECQTWNRVDTSLPPCFMQGFDLSRFTFIEFDEIIRDDYEYRGKVYLLCHHLPGELMSEML